MCFSIKEGMGFLKRFSIEVAINKLSHFGGLNRPSSKMSRAEFREAVAELSRSLKIADISQISVEISLRFFLGSVGKTDAFTLQLKSNELSNQLLCGSFEPRYTYSNSELGF